MQPLPSRDQLFREVVTRAVTSPVSLFLTTTGLLLVSSPAAWPLGVAALAAESAWVWYRVRDPRHARQSSEAMLRARWHELVRRLEQISGVLDHDTAAALAGIVDAQERLLALYSTETPTMPHTRMELTSLLQHCLSLAEKRHQLQSYVLSFRRGDIDRQTEHLQLRVAESRDPALRGLFEQALAQKREELDNYLRLGEAVGHIDAQLAVVRCTFDNVLSKVVRMQSADAVHTEPAADPVFQELNQLTSRVASLEASLNETLSLGHAP